MSLPAAPIRLSPYGFSAELPAGLLKNSGVPSFLAPMNAHPRITCSSLIDFQQLSLSFM